MGFFQRLQQQTEAGRTELLSAPLIHKGVEGTLTLNEYVAFLMQAYHHVKHTVPLLMNVGGRLPESKEWLRSAVAEYIEEELGHQEWILNDIAACGFSRAAAQASQPSAATEFMVSYAYDTVQRINPLGFFGMVHVLEGTSIRVADRAADAIQASLDLPDAAFSYLRSHGALDQDHVKFFEDLMDRIEAQDEQQLIVHCANRFYHLYGNIFRTIDGAQAALLNDTPLQTA